MKEVTLATEREATIERRLLEGAKRGHERAREQLVERNLRLVHAIAFRYRELGLPVEDLVQEGAIGLLEAIDRFDASEGVEFGVYASWRIRRAILDALTDRSRLVRLPKQVVQRRRAVARADARLRAENGHPPSAGELAEDTGLSEAAVLEDRCAPGAPISLDEPVSAEGESLSNLVADATAPDPEIEAAAEERERLLAEALAELPVRQREVVTRHFGIGRPATPIPVLAGELELSAQRARAIERDALYGLRGAFEARGSDEAALLACGTPRPAQ